MDWISAIGSFLSLIGVLVALHQIGKVRSAAESAKVASELASSSLQKNMAMIDISSCITVIEEIKVLIRGDRYEASLLRVSDLVGKIIQLKTMPKSDGVTEINKISSLLAQLGVLRDLLENKLHKPDTAVNPSKINGVLSSISDELHAWIGENKFALAERLNDQ
jgi:hypothetical protein